MFRARVPPRTPRREFMALLQTPLVGAGEGTPSPYTTPLAAFGASILPPWALATRHLAFDDLEALP